MIELYCAVHAREALEVEYSYDGVRVKSCMRCLDTEREEGYNEGREEGYDDGYRAGKLAGGDA